MLLTTACSAPRPHEPLRGHLSTESLVRTEHDDKNPGTPETVPSSASQQAQVKEETYSVIVNNVPAHDLLF